MDKQKVALVLSMGGARGIAHIGVIEELLRHNFEITSIAGSSMGAMVGAMYASGKLEECKEWLYSWDKRKMWELADLTLRCAVWKPCVANAPLAASVWDACP